MIYTTCDIYPATIASCNQRSPKQSSKQLRIQYISKRIAVTFEVGTRPASSSFPPDNPFPRWINLQSAAPICGTIFPWHERARVKGQGFTPFSEIAYFSRPSRREAAGGSDLNGPEANRRNTPGYLTSVRYTISTVKKQSKIYDRSAFRRNEDQIGTWLLWTIFWLASRKWKFYIDKCTGWFT